MRRAQVLVVLVAFSIGLTLAAPAYAQGYGVYEQGACAMGRGGATVAAPCPDGSGIFFNPAGIAFDPALQIGLGSVLIAPIGQFVNSTSQRVSDLNKHVYPVPNVYLSKGFGSKFAAGFGVMAPYGLTTDWPADSEGRFLGYKSLVQAVYMQPTFAVKLNEKVSVGIGVDITYVKVQLKQRVDLAPQLLTSTLTFAALGVPSGTDFADVDLSGHTYSTGIHAGLLAKANDKISFGVRFLSGQTAKVDNGKLTTNQIKTNRFLPIALGPTIPAGTPIDALLATKFADGAVLESGQKGTTKLALPAQFTVGTAIQATPKLAFFADYRFMQWSKFDQLVINKENSTTPTVTVEAYKNANAFHLGTEYQVAPAFVLRAGYFATTAAAPDQTVTPNLPEGSRNNYSVGIGAKLSPKARVDVAYMYLQQGDRAGRSTDGGMAVPTTAVNNGVFKFHANLFGVMLGLRF